MKVLFIQNVIMHYRVDVYNEIANFCQLTVVHSGNPIEFPVKFQEKIVKAHKFKGFFWQRNIKAMSKNFDVIIAMFDLKWLSTLHLLFSSKPKHQRIYLWGIGVSSQGGLNNKNTFDFIRFKIAKMSNGVIFYSDYPKKFYLEKGIAKTKLFTAHNTVKVIYEEKNYVRTFEYFLFIGNLHPRKKIDDLIKAYAKYKVLNFEHKKLKIIGGGEHESKLMLLVKKMDLEKDITFLGKINDSNLKKEIFEKAIASISPGQAGLSVLESFAYGVPYISYKEAITGGEIFNIKNSYNGFLINSKDELVKVMSDMTTNTKMTKNLSVNAMKYYKENRKIDKMVNSFKKIIFNEK